MYYKVRHPLLAFVQPKLTFPDECRIHSLLIVDEMAVEQPQPGRRGKDSSSFG